MVTAEGKCSIKVLRPEEEAHASDATGRTSSTMVSPGPGARSMLCDNRHVVYRQAPTCCNCRCRLRTGVQLSRESDSSEQPRSARLSDCCSDQSSVTSMSLNASIDFTCAGAAAAAADSQGDAVPPLIALPPPGAKKAQGATELYAFALAAPRLDAPPRTGEQPTRACYGHGLQG